VFDYDFVIVGSGFGGSVAGLRLVEQGHRVLMLEKGRNIPASELPKSNWNLKRWLWMPRLGLRGLFRMTVFRHMTVLSGSRRRRWLAHLWGGAAHSARAVFSGRQLARARRLVRGARTSLRDGAPHARRDSQLTSVAQTQTAAVGAQTVQ